MKGVKVLDYESGGIGLKYVDFKGTVYDCEYDTNGDYCIETNPLDTFPIREVFNTIRTAMYYVKKGNTDMAIRLLTYCLRILSNSDALFDFLIKLDKNKNEFLKHTVLNTMEFSNIHELEKELYGCWTVGTTFITYYKHIIAFIEQCNCCNEFAVYVFDKKTHDIDQIESVSITKDNITKMINHVLSYLDL